jgi:hypothetical protein
MLVVLSNREQRNKLTKCFQDSEVQLLLAAVVGRRLEAAVPAHRAAAIGTAAGA